MNNNEESINYFNFQTYDQKYLHQYNLTDPDYQFQKVQSIIRIARQPQNLSQQNYQFRDQNQQFCCPSRQANNINTQMIRLQENRPRFKYSDLKGQKNKIRQNNQNFKFSKSNTQTNVVSQNQSMEYISSQQPSFSNKGQFTILQDFNLDRVSPVKRNISQQEYNHFVHEPSSNFNSFKKQLKNQNQYDWQASSFAPKSKNILSLNQKCIKIFQYIQQLKFMKQGLQSKLKQQKILFNNELQQMKKYIFKLNIKYEKQLLQFSKDKNYQEQKDRISQFKQSSLKIDDNSKQNQLTQLKKYCRKLQEQKAKSQQKYQNTLKIYQQEIQNISHQLQNKLAQQSQGPRFGTNSVNNQCLQCIKYQHVLHQAKQLSSYQTQIWKNRLQEQQEKHQKAMKRLQQKVFSLQDQFEYLQKNKNQIEKQFKNKQKQLLHRQSQIQYRFKDIQRREREIQMKEKFIQKEKFELQRKKQKITDYQLKILKQQRKTQNQFKQKQIMTSQYFSNCQKRNIIIKNNKPPLQRSDSRSSRSSKIDINARLKEIQSMRGSGLRNGFQNGTSRNSSTDSRISGAKQLNSPRVNMNRNNLKDYGNIASLTNISSKRQNGRQSHQMIKLSEKLSSLTQTIENQLRQIG